MTKKITTLGWSDDYACCTIDHIDFYYGWEQEWCPVHGQDCECDEREPCFVAIKDGEEVMRMTMSEIEEYDGRLPEPAYYLLIGIEQYYTK